MALDNVVPSATPPSRWNLPNLITLVRILLTPVFVWLLFLDNGADGVARYAAAAFFLLAIATDGVDGAIARRRNLVTNLGAILDPIADKVATGSALVALSILHELPWWVTIVILVREVGITALRFVVLSKRVIPASRGGKVKTVLQSLAISLALVPLWTIFGDWVNGVNMVVMSVAVVVTVLTGLDYLVQALRHNRVPKPSDRLRVNTPEPWRNE